MIVVPPNRVIYSCARLQLLGLVVLTIFGGLAASVNGQSQTVARDTLLSTQLFTEIEDKVLPRLLVDGPSQHNELAEYYMAENLELAFRVEDLSKCRWHNIRRC